ncbi:hypothetical protein GOQ27_07085 [Clostridium sp. D2Q-11]|uniref:Uncharacterized protein n=1 Tax=Anaeromonas frigoriresistens TaxID=2683708 RepID=A0A942Z685_9FIRM|nr:hypothetical protein [Anaeromonas frigoriresistens]MBS4538221.1 hypothetical protein [Anaeromonas frigoriresistens]
MLYILSKDNLEIKDIIQDSSYDIKQDINLTGKSEFKVAEKLLANEGDYIIHKDEGYKGIIENIETEKYRITYIIHANEIDNIFDRKVILSNEEIILNTGIEDFIKKTIEDNFVISNDDLLNKTYINVSVSTHTPINASIDTNDGIYNLRTYLGNVKERYDIYLDYKFNKDTLDIIIYRSNAEVLEVDATIEDIITYQEFYSVDVVSKVTVLSKGTGNTFDYFLLTDRTTTTDKNNPNRAKGSIEVETCETDDEAYQKALDTFKSNSYQHNIEINLTKDSMIYDINDFYIGRNLKIKTNDNGIYHTFVREINKKSNSNIYIVKCGNMKVTLIEKLKGVI